MTLRRLKADRVSARAKAAIDTPESTDACQGLRRGLGLVKTPRAKKGVPSDHWEAGFLRR